MRRRAFSLLEIVLVLVILGVISAIAIPRMNSAASNSTNTAVSASTSQVQRSVDLYAAEHLERTPAADPDGSTNPSGQAFIDRLIGRTSETGATSAGGVYGPYLRSWPTNPVNKKSTVRIGGAAAGANTDGWRFDPATGAFLPDHVAILNGQITSGSGSVTSGSTSPGTDP